MEKIMENFDDIRPYNDSEVASVIQKLINNKEFINVISGFQIPKLKKFFPLLANILVKNGLKKRLLNIKSIAQVQNQVSTYVKGVLDKSSNGVTETGLSDLSKEKGYLFVSNHRDIAMDPALISYLLHKAKLRTVEIAIGDNLLKKDFVSHLMRLNKSFIVKRSAIGREKLLATKKLSQYIHFAIENGNNVWIAQKEGRAKDGLDKTDPTIIKMFHMGKKDETEKSTLKEGIDNLHIIPVSICYEYDPCDEMKARELFEIEKNGFFKKDENSDFKSISLGIEGFKGEIHLSFGKEIIAQDSDAVIIAHQLDEQIILNYKLFPSNYLAYEILQKQNSELGLSLEKLGLNLNEINSKRVEFDSRMNNFEEELKPYILKMYANPVFRKLDFYKS